MRIFGKSERSTRNEVWHPHPVCMEAGGWVGSARRWQMTVPPGSHKALSASWAQAKPCCCLQLLCEHLAPDCWLPSGEVFPVLKCLSSYTQHLKHRWAAALSGRARKHRACFGKEHSNPFSTVWENCIKYVHDFRVYSASKIAELHFFP